ncbi:MAG: hypothetical protein EXX96DRAFT_553752 [Benjaminiella poitrasii]|nr:MAG: hypothetical protein EXX96DRAFT_553752 [Benjaminiella poitrasii]
MSNNQCNNKLDIYPDKDSFILHRNQQESNITGTIESSIAPLWTQIRFIGQEQLNQTIKTIIDTTYLLSTRPTDWKQTTTISHQYSLPFSLAVPSHIPISFQVPSQTGSFEGMLDGVYYRVEVMVASIDHLFTCPIHFHLSLSPLCTLSNDDLTRSVHGWPKRVIWGVVQQQQFRLQRWHYELEFSNILDLDNPDVGCILVRLKSMFRFNKDCCCLIGCQLIQTVQLEGYKHRYEIISIATNLITSPNATWNDPCQMILEVDNDSILLPTVTSERLAVYHFIKISLAFGSLEGRPTDIKNIEYPITFIGYRKPLLHNTTCQIIDYKPQRSNSISSYGSTIKDVSSEDSAIDVFSFKSNSILLA